MPIIGLEGYSGLNLYDLMVKEGSGTTGDTVITVGVIIMIKILIMFVSLVEAKTVYVCICESTKTVLEVD